MEIYQVKRLPKETTILSPSHDEGTLETISATRFLHVPASQQRKEVKSVPAQPIFLCIRGFINLK